LGDVTVARYALDQLPSFNVTRNVRFDAEELKMQHARTLGREIDPVPVAPPGVGVCGQKCVQKKPATPGATLAGIPDGGGLIASLQLEAEVG
jgi:hypothetical protein